MRRPEMRYIVSQKFQEGGVFTTFLDDSTAILPYKFDEEGCEGLHHYVDLFPNEAMEAAAPWN